MRKKLGKFCFVLAAVLLAAGFIYYLPKLLDYMKAIELYDDIRDEYTDDPEPETEDDLDEISKYLLSIGLDPELYGCIDVDGEALLEENEDYIGWIYVPQTDISYPVVKSKDNADYLHTNFQKEYNYAGTVFLDCQCSEGLDNHHTILYGHNMRIGTMFAGLNKFRDQEYAEEHPIFWFIMPDGEKKLYSIFSVCTPNPYDRVQYGIDGLDFLTDEEYLDAVNTMQEESIVDLDTDIELDIDSYVMSLSTCTGNNSFRCMVHGVYTISFEQKSEQE